MEDSDQAIGCKPCQTCVDWLQNFLFDWKRRRYCWRAAIFYDWVVISLVIGILLTLLFNFFFSNFDFFTNYECQENSITLINTNNIVLMVIVGIIIVMSLAMSRLIHMFSNYSMSDFMSSGKWADKMGCLVKWIPWLIAIVAIAWGLMNITNLLWVFLVPKSWCSQRWTAQGQMAVKNCRMWERASSGCASLPPEANAQTSTSNLKKCNGSDYLDNLYFLRFIPKVSTGTAVYEDCSFSKPSVCLAYSRLLADPTGFDFNSAGPEVSACVGDSLMNVNNLIEDDNVSDLYRYVELYILIWSIVWIILVLIFYYFKSISYYDAIFFQAYEQSENIIMRTIKTLTPWSQ